MSILARGCNCTKCIKKKKDRLEVAREEWRKGKRKIEIVPYHYDCGDGCCADYGEDVYINGVDINCVGEYVVDVLDKVMEFLEIENVEIEYGDEGDI